MAPGRVYLTDCVHLLMHLDALILIPPAPVNTVPLPLHCITPLHILYITSTVETEPDGSSTPPRRLVKRCLDATFPKDGGLINTAIEFLVGGKVYATIRNRTQQRLTILYGDELPPQQLTEATKEVSASIGSSSTGPLPAVCIAAKLGDKWSERNDQTQVQMETIEPCAPNTKRGKEPSAQLLVHPPKSVNYAIHVTVLLTDDLSRAHCVNKKLCSGAKAAVVGEANIQLSTSSTSQ